MLSGFMRILWKLIGINSNSNFGGGGGGGRGRGGFVVEGGGAWKTESNHPMIHDTCLV